MLLSSRSRCLLVALFCLPCVLPLRAAQAEALPELKALRELKALPEGMVAVEAGAFMRGSNRKDPRAVLENDAGPRASVTLPLFYLDKTEVTNAQYKQWCDAAHYPPPPHWIKGAFPAREANFPVTHVNWFEAQAYAKWRGKRLPTESEWEKAARGTDNRTFPWGESWDQNRVAWNGISTEAVGSHSDGASPYGALDMSGNVYEWTSDWYQPYEGAARNGNTYFGTTYKVIRGGAYAGIDFIAMTWFRSVMRPTSRSEWVGFRCAQSAA